MRNTICLLTILCLIGFCAECFADPIYREAANSQELIKAASEIGASGGTIALKPGTYIIDKTILFSNINCLNITGTGWDTTIQKRGDGDVLDFVNCGFISVRNLMINGDGDAKIGSGIVFKGTSSSNTIDTCRISGNPVSGVRFEGDGKSPQSTNSVKYCHFIDNHEDQLWSSNNNDFFIIGNQFGAHQRRNELAPKTGVVLDHSSAGTYTMNYHWENKVAMRLGPGSHFNRIENNRFENSREAGVIIGSPDSKEGLYLNIFTGNTIHTNSMANSGQYSAVEAYNAHQVTFCANQIFSWDSAHYLHKSSLVIHDGCDRWIVKDNIMQNNRLNALVYNMDGKHIIKDNILE